MTELSHELEDLAALERSAAELETGLVSLREATARAGSARAELERVLAGVEAVGVNAPAASTADPVDPRAAPAKRRRRGRLLPVAMLVVGSLLVGDAVVTLAWQEPLTALYTARQQSVLGGRLDDLQKSFAPVPRTDFRPAPGLSAAQRATAQRAAQRHAFAASARRLAHTAKDGDPIGRLRIPHVNDSWVMVQGIEHGDLRSGPGHYDQTPLPGQPGTFGVAGHRTTYAAPFRRLDKLRPGDRVEALMPYGRFVYRVEGTRIVRPEQIDVLKPVRGQRIVLTACHPLYSSKLRIVVTARLAFAQPRTA